MRIRKIEAIPVRYDMDYEIWDSLSCFSARQAILVKITTDEGATGYGESAYFGGPLDICKTIIDKELAPFFIGKDPFMNEGIWHAAYTSCVKNGRRGAVVAALSGLDIAVWDIKGKACGQPVYKLLGGQRSRVEAYASAGFYAEGKDEAALADEMCKHRDAGFASMKMKVAYYGRETDLRRVLAVREALGSAVPLAIDANNNWNLCTAKWFVDHLCDANIAFVEEPLGIENIADSAELCRYSTIPIAGYEQETTKYGFAALIQNRAIHIVQPDVIWVGGFTEAKKVAAMAEAACMPCYPHSFSTGLCLAANLQLMATLPTGLLEMDRNPNPLRDDLIRGEIAIDKHSMVTMPDKPGLGVEVDEQVIARFRIDR